MKERERERDKRVQAARRYKFCLLAHILYAEIRNSSYSYNYCRCCRFLFLSLFGCRSNFDRESGESNGKKSEREEKEDQVGETFVTFSLQPISVHFIIVKQNTGTHLSTIGKAKGIGIGSWVLTYGGEKSANTESATDRLKCYS